MLSKTHIACGLTIGLSILITQNNISLTEYVPGVILGSVMPDVDTKKSWVSQSIPFIDDKLRESKILKHRGLTHGISGIIVSLSIYVLFINNFMLGFTIGYISHCLLDSLTTKLHILTNIKNDKIIFNIFWIINLLLIFINTYYHMI